MEGHTEKNREQKEEQRAKSGPQRIEETLRDEKIREHERGIEEHSKWDKRKKNEKGEKRSEGKRRDLTTEEIDR